MVIIVAAILSTAATILKPMQDENEEIAKIQSILMSVKVESTKENAKEIYKKMIGSENELVVDNQGNILEGENAFAINMQKEAKEEIDKRRLPVFIANLENGQKAYILPLSGKGLWGPVWGYIAIKDDLRTVIGATFDHKSETPGLGAEINKEPFSDQFIGKAIFDEDYNFTSIKIVKGGAKEGDMHGVDAISGGTITSNGVSDMLYDCMIGYKSYFEKIKNNQ
jgi:Na+-transporting NADH:ubiquinone oxidoreductase subunit C